MASRLDLSSFKDEEVMSMASSSHAQASSEVAPVQQVPEVERPKVTPEIVDRAVENVLGRLNYPPEVKETFRKLLASDPNTGFSSHYHMGKSDTSIYHAYQKFERRVVYIPLVLSPEETAELVRYAPEFDLRFTEQEDQDHALAASMRTLDHQLVMSRVPNRISLKDVGGNPVFHVRSGTPNIHVCCPKVDRKDPSRDTLHRMRIAKVLRSPGFSDVSKESAARYLEGDTTFCCGKPAQVCYQPSKVTMSCHVYDVKLEDWPRIMQASGSVMHVGCLIFPTQAFSHTHGVLPSSKARYEVDVEKNEIRMSFVESPAWWYTHSWLDFMRYGADQMIDYGGERYSYKITERRGDTVFFQILRVAGTATLDRQWYKLPGVPTVRVEGFEYQQGAAYSSAVGRSPLKPKVYWFPAALWDDMLQQAEMDFERGVMTYDKLYNYYRTVSPRNTINGVLISGGQRVPHDQMVPLIVHVGMSAAMSVMLGQRITRQLTEEQVRKRLESEYGKVYKLLSTFWRSVVSVASALSYYPLRWLFDRLSGMSEGILLSSLVEWSYEPELVEIPFSSIVGDYFMKRSVNWRYHDTRHEDELHQHYVASAKGDHMRAILKAPALSGLIAELCADGLSKDELKSMAEAASSSTVGSSTAVETNSKEPRQPGGDSLGVERRNAILECIEESKLEKDKLQERCDTVYRRCTGPGGEPIEDVIRKHAEEYHQVDFWYVNRGVLSKSVLGVEPAECRYSAVFTLKHEAGERFHTLQDVTNEPTFGEFAKEYKVLSDCSMTGWVMTIDRLEVYNGPEIQATMYESLNVEHDYVVELQQGPPGCGKTRDLLANITRADIAMCPVKESAVDTRNRLKKQDPVFPDLRLRSRTVDSYLVNYRNGANSQLTCDTIHADECFMTHSGKWYAVAGLLKAKKIVAYGDIKQIPHIPRVQAPSLYLRIKADIVHVKHDIYRCPADAVAAWAHVYEYRARTHSTVKHSISVHENWQGLVLPEGCVLLCMYQADKKELFKRFSAYIRSKKLRIMTVHESEGKTFEDVWLFRFDVRKREDNASLFDKEAYCLVAMSRHTRSFKYIRPRNLQDVVDRWVVNASNVRAVSASADVSTVGQSVQFV